MRQSGAKQELTQYGWKKGGRYGAHGMVGTCVAEGVHVNEENVILGGQTTFSSDSSRITCQVMAISETKGPGHVVTVTYKDP